ncbi:MAG: type II toxin-antitoxin system VapC family toxin [Candidatus Solibacter usitatus]|nr:type II toxin-antitoxin system VapC family toxin [Candidatus Solibacter usitatus]
MRKVIDSWALMAWIQGQPAAGRVAKILEQASSGSVELLISMINVGEVYYLLAKRLGPRHAEDFLNRFPALPMRSVVPDGAGIIEAAKLKGSYPISYADSFAAALAIRQRVPLVTGDHEFKRLSRILKLEWIG